MQLVCAHFFNENEEQIIPYILGRVAHIVSMGLLGDESDIILVKMNEVLKRKMTTNSDNKSMINMIMVYYISFTSKANANDLLAMATND